MTLHGQQLFLRQCKTSARSNTPNRSLLMLRLDAAPGTDVNVKVMFRVISTGFGLTMYEVDHTHKRTTELRGICLDASTLKARRIDTNVHLLRALLSLVTPDMVKVLCGS